MRIVVTEVLQQTARQRFGPHSLVSARPPPVTRLPRVGSYGGKDRVHYLVERLPGVDTDRAGCAQAALYGRQLVTWVFASVPDTAPVVVVPARIQSRQHRGLVDLQQEHLSEPVGHLLLIVRTAADVQRRRRRGPDQLVQSGRAEGQRRGRRSRSRAVIRTAARDRLR